MSRLVIHPLDKTTEFLQPIYTMNGPCTLVRGGVDWKELHRLIATHDEIIMLGHGTQMGLLGAGQFKQRGHVITDDSAPYLIDKRCIYIWCHANQYVDHNDLTGFYTGMFISEMHEAYACGLRDFTQDDIDASNKRFTIAVAQAVEDKLSAEDMYRYVHDRYTGIAGNDVISYNAKRLGWA